mmetsp:Transcript_37767/g.88710  ORF Transcript_37767/g.88710 Transcript_37767/m.88710 type:complete len:277 (-) Transcript_37767:59-889(-)
MRSTRSTTYGEALRSYGARRAAAGATRGCGHRERLRHTQGGLARVRLLALLARVAARAGPRLRARAQARAGVLLRNGLRPAQAGAQAAREQEHARQADEGKSCLWRRPGHRWWEPDLACLSRNRRACHPRDWRRYGVIALLSSSIWRKADAHSSLPSASHEALISCAHRAQRVFAIGPDLSSVQGAAASKAFLPPAPAAGGAPPATVAEVFASSQRLRSGTIARLRLPCMVPMSNPLLAGLTAALTQRRLSRAGRQPALGLRASLRQPELAPGALI